MYHLQKEYFYTNFEDFNEMYLGPQLGYSFTQHFHPRFKECLSL